MLPSDTFILSSGLLPDLEDDDLKDAGDLAEDNLKQVIQNIKDVKKADEAYQGFGGIKEGQKDEAKFIIETKEIKKK